MSHINPVHVLHRTFWRSILILPSRLSLGLQSGFFRPWLATKILYTSLLSSIRATWTANLILLDLITCTILDDEYDDNERIQHYNKCLYSIRKYSQSQTVLYCANFIVTKDSELCMILKQMNRGNNTAMHPLAAPIYRFQLQNLSSAAIT